MVISLKLMERCVYQAFQRVLLTRQAGTETDQAKDEARAKKLWDLSVKVLKEKAKYDVQL